MKVIFQISLIFWASAFFARPLLAQSEVETTLFRLANEMRIQRNAPPLVWNSALARTAQWHLRWSLRRLPALQEVYPGESNLMTRAILYGVSYSTIAENNDGGATSPADILQAWVRKPGELATLLDPTLNNIGISIEKDHGLLYAVSDFAMITSTPLSPDAVEGAIISNLQKYGIGRGSNLPQARKACQDRNGPASDAKEVVQWNSANPTMPPEAVLHKLGSGDFTSATVTACLGQLSPEPLTSWHIVVSLN